MEKVFTSKNEFLEAMSVIYDIQKKAKATVVKLVKQAGGKVDVSDKDISLAFIDYDGSFEVREVEVDDKDDICLHTISNNDGGKYNFWWYEFEQDVEAMNIIAQAVFDASDLDE